MRGSHFFVVALVTNLLACAGESGGDDTAVACAAASLGGMGAVGGGDPADNRRIVPEDVSVMALEGGNGVLELQALTLRDGPNGQEVYAMLKNVGSVLACDAGFSVELYDRSEQSLTAGISALLTQHLYRLNDGTGAIASCVGPGDATMAAVTDFPVKVAAADVGFAVYRCPYFELDATPVDGLAVEIDSATTSSAGVTYSGKLGNLLEVPVKNPTVTVFPLNGIGRPLGVTTGNEMLEIPPCGTWSFTTGPASDAGSAYAAFPTAAIGPLTP